MSNLSQLESGLVGVAGEYLVAAELSLRGYLAAITLRNSRGIDIIASSSDASKSVSIQVKTNKTGKVAWPLSKKSEDFFSDSHFYVFVRLGPIGLRSDFFVVPSETVAIYISTAHRDWLSKPRRDGMPRRDVPMRVFADFERKYLERWDILPL